MQIYCATLNQNHHYKLQNEYRGGGESTYHLVKYVHLHFENYHVDFSDQLSGSCTYLPFTFSGIVFVEFVDCFHVTP